MFADQLERRLFIQSCEDEMPWMHFTKQQLKKLLRENGFTTSKKVNGKTKALTESELRRKAVTHAASGTLEFISPLELRQLDADRKSKRRKIKCKHCPNIVTTTSNSKNPTNTKSECPKCQPIGTKKQGGDGMYIVKKRKQPENSTKPAVKYWSKIPVKKPPVKRKGRQKKRHYKGPMGKKYREYRRNLNKKKSFDGPDWATIVKMEEMKDALRPKKHYKGAMGKKYQEYRQNLNIKQSYKEKMKKLEQQEKKKKNELKQKKKKVTAVNKKLIKDKNKVKKDKKQKKDAQSKVVQTKKQLKEIGKKKDKIKKKSK